MGEARRRRRSRPVRWTRCPWRGAPAGERGLQLEIQNGLAFTASVEHIHAHSATEVHFGGPITKSNDPSLVGKFVHCVAIDGSPHLFSLMN